MSFRALQRPISIGGIGLLSLTACSSTRTPSSAPTTATSTSTTVPPTTGVTPTTAPASTTTSPSSTATLGPYLPLYPFDSLAGVQQWQAEYQSGGHQPWHLDPGMTAVAFAGWLGYSNINSSITEKTDRTGDHVSVGFYPNGTTGRPVVAAVVHLVRWGTGTNIPWEVVGTDDTTFTVTTPSYGATIASPVTAGGRIAGVDENIKMQVRIESSSSPVGSFCCKPAGGTNTPWTASVAFTAPSGTVLTIAAQTGGHVATVERFAVTGVRNR